MYIKNPAFLLISLIGFLIASLQVAADDPAIVSSVLKVKVKNIRHNQGKIYLAVYDKEESFMKDVFVIESIRVNSLHELGIEIKLPQGKYAISIFHDVNGNDELNTNFIGIPKEPYGFSNNPKIRFGPPAFNQSAFELVKENQEIEIFLN